MRHRIAHRCFGGERRSASPSQASISRARLERAASMSWQLLPGTRPPRGRGGPRAPPNRDVYPDLGNTPGEHSSAQAAHVDRKSTTARSR